MAEEKTILIVTSDKHYANAIETALSRIKTFSIETCISPGEAAQRLENKSFDTVVVHKAGVGHSDKEEIEGVAQKQNTSYVICENLQRGTLDRLGSTVESALK